MIYNFLHSTTLLHDACTMFREHAVEGLEANEESIKSYLDRIADGRDRARAAHRLRQGRRDRQERASREDARSRKPRSHSATLPSEEYDKIVVPKEMTYPK